MRGETWGEMVRQKKREGKETKEGGGEGGIGKGEERCGEMGKQGIREGEGEEWRGEKGEG